MSALEPIRDELRALLGPAVLLRRDQAVRALFICDAPRRLPNAAEIHAQLLNAGFAVAEERGLWRVDLNDARRAAFVRACAPHSLPRDPALYSLCRSLLSQGETPPGLQPWPLIRLTLLRLDAGETARLARELSSQIAILKRNHAPLPTAVAHLIANHEGGAPC